METKGRIRMATSRQALPYPRFAIAGFEPMVEPKGAPFTDLKPPPLYGIGLIEGVANQVIADGCDPDDKNHDGISGRVSPSFNGVPGRLGAKAFTHTIEDFAVDAFAFEIGITGPQRAAWLTKDKDSVADPEITPETVALVAGYIRGLAPPPRNGDHPAGAKVFETVGCVGCHRPETAPNVPAFSDLCVHDLGPGFNDPINDPGLGDSEWRTAPLWGLRLRKVYFHDGRTDNLDAAIRMHAGEASKVIERYGKLKDTDRADLMQFLSTL
jgi:CxxC motif-containing protein (DUF1111 family)